MKLVAWTVGPVAIMLAAACAAPPQGSPAPRHAEAPRARATAAARTMPADLAPVAPRVEPTAAPASEAAPAAGEAPVPPRGVLADGGRLQSWMFGLPDAEFAPLAGTKQLDSYVAAVVRWFSEREARGEDVHFEIADFMAKINARACSAKR